ncbi:Nn.00g101140.m01.CDS01 [Neocucurbitaria sp. VM-36]
MPAIEALEGADGVYSLLRLRCRSDIRLMRILANDGNNIACELRVVNLESNPLYTALSYTWGPSTGAEERMGVSSSPTHTICCNDRKILVTKNLYDFLRVRNNFHASRDMWIDMICINQEDQEERTSQVSMMAEIYRSAETVIVWLGDEDEDTWRSFTLVRVLSKLCNDCLRQITPDKLNSEATLGILGPYCQISFWRSVARLFQRKYFTRVWIIQEIILARKIIVLCGRHSVDWEDLASVSRFLTLTAWTRWTCVREGFSAHDPDQVHHAIPNILTHIKRIRTGGEINVMLDCLITSRRFLSSDPRDKVYALLGLVEDYIKGKHRFNPMYGERSVSETYTLAAIQVLEDSDDLLVLAYAEGDKFQTIVQYSWVPDWSCPRVLGLGVVGYKRYSAAGNLPRSLTINEKALSLKVRGLRLDDIVLAGESKHEFLKGTPCPSWWSILRALPPVYHTGQTRMEVFWRTLITDTAGIDRQHPAPSNYGPAFISWITSKSAAFPGPAGQHAISDDLLSLYDGGVRDTEEPVSSSEYETVFSHAQHIKLFMTKALYLGVGSESLREQDSIWIIAGSRIPLILRDGGTGVFRLVGGAYLHGFMHGEALEQDLSFQDITIV